MINIVAPGHLPVLPLQTLGWKGFQDLSGTILREVLGQTYAIWSPTNDAGRDGAFVGTWSPQPNETLSGHFVTQSKHTSSTDTTLTLSALEDEFAKIAKLVEDGCADIYLLFTNHRITGEMELAAGRRLSELGIKQSYIFGDHWISAQVYESSRLRALVPRVYGIGDLSEIIDERAQDQARAVLATLEDEIKTFVPVEAYRDAYTVLDKHGFVCLVGEPGSGKSTIAAVLTLVAADLWKLAPIRVQSPQDFGSHWNPNRTDQIFWVDDAFGDTQYDATKSRGWRSMSRELRAALKKGARFVLTTRDYIFRRAMHDFQKGDLPVTDIGQIQISVEALTLSEKEAILYNHIKLGSQPKTFRTAIKRYLPLVAQRAHMLPEVAKRLAAPVFTGSLSMTVEGVKQFAEDPDQYLLEVLQGLGRAERASMVTLLSRGGTLRSPIVADAGIKNVLESLGVTLAELQECLATLRNTLVRLVLDETQPHWSYRHPTIHDAVSTYVACDPELVGTYLRVAAVKQLVSEVYFETEDKPQGAHVAVPQHLYGSLAERLVEAFDDRNALASEMMQFLAFRADDQFVRIYVRAAKNLEHQLLGFGSYLDASQEIIILERLNELGLLTAATRRATIERIKELAVETPDTGWIDAHLLSGAEQEEIQGHVKVEFVDDPYWVISTWDDNYQRDQSPEDYFEPLLRAIKGYAERFKSTGDMDAVSKLEQIRERVLQKAYDREDDYRPRQSYRGSPMPKQPAAAVVAIADLSRFDDIDE